MRKFVRYVVIVAFLSAFNVMKAQDQAVYNNYIANQGILNPAYNGTRDFISGLMVLRSQWTGMSGAPFTGALNVHSPIDKVKNLGAGLVVTEDHLGFTNQFEVFVAGSYRLQVDRKNTLALGLQLGFKNIVYDATKAIKVDFDDPLFQDRVSKFGFNFGFGAYFYNEKYFAGLSIPRFFVNQYNTDKQEIKNTVKFSDLHSYLYGGYVFDINDVKIKPTGLIRIVPGAPLEIDVTCSAMFVKNLWVGLSYRTVSEAVALVEYQFGSSGNDKNTKGKKGKTMTWAIRYSFDYSISDIRKYAVAGSHEIGIQFDFQTKKRPGMRSIRYF
ncbi:MAG: type IX secretion system membrane protein PorP/SprF [Bacteroidales bacterium]|nr:type IX secretion system membrane protein PorP/SprF [Bacteroidales bacterium]